MMGLAGNAAGETPLPLQHTPVESDPNRPERLSIGSVLTLVFILILWLVLLKTNLEFLVSYPIFYVPFMVIAWRGFDAKHGELDQVVRRFGLGLVLSPAIIGLLIIMLALAMMITDTAMWFLQIVLTFLSIVVMEEMIKFRLIQWTFLQGLPVATQSNNEGGSFDRDGSAHGRTALEQIRTVRSGLLTGAAVSAGYVTMMGLMLAMAVGGNSWLVALVTDLYLAPLQILTGVYMGIQLIRQHCLNQHTPLWRVVAFPIILRFLYYLAFYGIVYAAVANVSPVAISLAAIVYLLAPLAVYFHIRKTISRLPTDLQNEAGYFQLFI